MMGMRARGGVLVVTVVAAVGITAALKPIPQPASYHDFADARTLLGIPRAMDVLSNLPFVVVGLAGVYVTLRNRSRFPTQRWSYVSLFVGLFLTGLGSAYYHLAPDNQRLVWDRLPMTIAMAGLIMLLLANRLPSTPVWVLPVLIMIGLGSVLQWSWSENRGTGDLRWYLLYQALAFIVGFVLLVMFPARAEKTQALFVALGANIASKVFELLDKPIYGIGHLVSGHTLKHLAAGLGFVPLVVWLAAQEGEGRERESRQT